MLGEMGRDIAVCLEDEEEHQYRHCRLDPEPLQDENQDAAENNSQVHRYDSLVGPEELLIDVYGSFGPLVPVSEVRIEVVGKEEGTR
jgi:hypothetical protein